MEVGLISALGLYELHYAELIPGKKKLQRVVRDAEARPYWEDNNKKYFHRFSNLHHQPSDTVPPVL